MAAGLQTRIWNNNLKSTGLLMLYPVAILGFIWVCSYLFVLPFHFGDQVFCFDFANGVIEKHGLFVAGVIFVWFCFSYFFHTAMIRKLVHARKVTRGEEPEIYNLLENLCIAEGMVMPRLNVIESAARNAFASGIHDRSYTITVTRGLVNALQKDELETVLAHELTHIKNRDVRFMMVAVVFTGMVRFLGEFVYESMDGIFDGPHKIFFFLYPIVGILWVCYVVMLMLRLLVSHKREYLADWGAIKMTKNPEALMRALFCVEGMDRLRGGSGDIMMMCIENSTPFMGSFRTHPPLIERIEAIAQMTNTPVPSVPPERRMRQDLEGWNFSKTVRYHKRNINYARNYKHWPPKE